MANLTDEHIPLHAGHDGIIEVDDHGSGSSSYTRPPPATMTSSVADYIYENGRRYHRYSEGKYAIPNDETEQDRLDFYHHQQLLMLKGRLFTAPLKHKQVKNVLDCGTGTGIWALDMAETYPEAHIVGVDLSPIQPEWILPNCTFDIDDLEREWTYPPDHFDFIHSRQLVISIKDWSKYFSQMFRCTKPGGFVELCEVELDKIHSDDNSVTPDHGIWNFFSKLSEVAKLAGLSLSTAEELKCALEEAGFVDVSILAQKQPFAPWPKDKELKRIGQLSLVTLVENKGIESYGLALFTRFGKMTQEQAQALCDRACADLKDRKVHVYNYLWHITGRKPERDPAGATKKVIEGVRDVTV